MRGDPRPPGHTEEGRREAPHSRRLVSAERVVVAVFLDPPHEWFVIAPEPSLHPGSSAGWYGRLPGGSGRASHEKRCRQLHGTGEERQAACSAAVIALSRLCST